MQERIFGLNCIYDNARGLTVKVDEPRAWMVHATEMQRLLKPDYDGYGTGGLMFQGASRRDSSGGESSGVALLIKVSVTAIV